MSGYTERIDEVLAGDGYPDLDVEGVEQWMRVGYPTLDHLTPAAFDAEVRIAAACEMEQPWPKEMR